MHLQLNYVPVRVHLQVTTYFGGQVAMHAHGWLAAFAANDMY